MSEWTSSPDSSYKWSYPPRWCHLIFHILFKHRTDQSLHRYISYINDVCCIFCRKKMYICLCWYTTFKLVHSSHESTYVWNSMVLLCILLILFIVSDFKVIWTLKYSAVLIYSFGSFFVAFSNEYCGCVLSFLSVLGPYSKAYIYIYIHIYILMGLYI